MSSYDMVVIGAVLLVMAISAVLGMVILKAIQNTGMFDSPLLEGGMAALRVFDTLALFLVFGIGIAAIISGFYVRSHPAFFIVAIILQLIVVMLSSVFSNIYMSIATHPDVATAANEFPMILLIFQNLPLIILVMGFVVAVIIYGKSASTPFGY